MIFGKAGFVSRRSNRRTNLNERSARPFAEILEGRQLLAVITVNSAGDANGPDGSSTLSLRQAIEIGNGTLATSSLTTAQSSLVSGPVGSSNTINFDILGTGPFVISPTSPLPTIQRAVTINGDSEPGAQANTNGPRQGKNTIIEIELNGSQAGPNATGLDLLSTGSTIKGLAIGGFSAGIYPEQGSTLIEGNFIGTDATGTKALPNGIGIQGFYGNNESINNSNTIGGTTAGAGNIISGNTQEGLSIIEGDLIQGNFIGTDVTGTKAIPNGEGNSFFPSELATIGGTVAAAGNLISGNTGIGVSVQDGSVVEGNFIGTDVTGTKAVPNGSYGVFGGGGDDTIGGSVAGAGNLISGNGGQGLYLQLSGYVIQNNLFGTDVTGTQPIPNNDVYNSGILNSATVTPSGTLISGSLEFQPHTSYQVEFLAGPASASSGASPAKTVVGSTVVTTADFGLEQFSFNLSQPLYDQAIYATATDPNGNTYGFVNQLTVGHLVPIKLIGPGSVATLGKPTTFAAIVGSSSGSIPNGPVDFFEDGVEIGSAPLNNVGVAVFITNSLSPGVHQITAQYTLDMIALTPSFSNAVALNVFAPLAFGGPSVTSDVFKGSNSVAVTFDRGLLSGPAQDLTNYKIIGPHGQKITIESAVYDPTTATLTLTTLQKLAPNQSDELTINGQTGDRVVDVFGIPLNGVKNGKPGHNFVGKITVKKPSVVKLAHPTGPKPKVQATSHSKTR